MKILLAVVHLVAVVWMWAFIIHCVGADNTSWYILPLACTMLGHAVLAVCWIIIAFAPDP